MATYQEQIEQRRASKAAKQMTALAELANIGDALAALERDGVMMPYERIAFLKMYVAKHPEINEAIGQNKSSGDVEKP